MRAQALGTIRKALFVAALLTLVTLVLTASLSPQPRIHVEGGLTVDFGTVYSGSAPVKTLTVKNIGTKTLRIKDIIVTCNCATAEISRKNIPPGKTALLKLKFRTEGLTGHIAKSVNIQSNDPVNFACLLAIKADIRSMLVWDPEALYFSAEDIGMRSSLRLGLFNTSDSSIRVLKAADLSNSLDLDFKPARLGWSR